MERQRLVRVLAVNQPPSPANVALSQSLEQPVTLLQLSGADGVSDHASQRSEQLKILRVVRNAAREVTVNVQAHSEKLKNLQMTRSSTLHPIDTGSVPDNNQAHSEQFKMVQMERERN